MKDYMSGATHGILEKAKRIKLLITDVDGVLTDGGIIYDDAGTEYKRFNVKDGQIVQYLRSNGISVGVISGRNSQVVRNRCEELKFDFHFHGIAEKGIQLEKILADMGISYRECAFIGDDIWDLPVLTKVGFSAAPADALPYVKERVNFVTSCLGGRGAFREVGDLILTSKGLLEPIIQKLSH
ncbi:MAG TPA: HAD-IIIA family hydrolase [Cyclobacteriaceae bacterium]|nr:HAD-IIIA family hydrolase [Cyclobacteriaceae bacterium]